MDRVIAHEPGVSATAIKNVTMNEPQFQGHFPERPLMPGVLIVEAMAQVGGLIVTQMPDLPKGLFVFAGIDGVRFRRCLLYTSPSPRDVEESRMPSSA